MVNNVSRRVVKLILPFAVPAEDRVKAFTKDMEMAGIFYLAESDRRKGEGHILKKPTEKLVFLAEICYPVWLIPWSRKTLLFDGLGLTKLTLSHDVLPDVGTFDNDIQGSAKTHETYTVALSQNANYFQNFIGKEEKTIEGLVTDSDFTKDFVTYLSGVEEIENSIGTKAILSPTIDKSEILASTEELSDLRARLKEEGKDLSRSMRLLSTRTRIQVKSLQGEIRRIRKTFEKRIRRVEPRVTQRIKQIQSKYEEEITRISRRFDRQLKTLHKNRVKFEKTHERFTAEMERCEAEIKSCRLGKDEGGEIQWNQKLQRIRKRLPILEKNIGDVNRKIGDVETAKKIEISRRRTKLDTRTDEAMKDIRELEASREAEIRMTEQDIASLEDMTSSIISQMSDKADSKKASLNEFDRIGAPKRRREYALVYLPFYFVCYETELKKRYVVYPPSIVGSMGILTKLRGVFGARKMKSFLEPRSKAITAFLNQIVMLTQENPVFEKDISDVGVKVSILRSTESRIAIKRGLKELREEKWISESELEIFSKLL